MVHRLKGATRQQDVSFGEPTMDPLAKIAKTEFVQSGVVNPINTCESHDVTSGTWIAKAGPHTGGTQDCMLLTLGDPRRP